MGQKLSQDVVINNDDGNSSNIIKKQSSWINGFYGDLGQRLTVVIVVILVLGLLIPIVCLQLIYTLLKPSQYTCNIKVSDRIQCFMAGDNVTRQDCLNVGCCWNAIDAVAGGIGQPSCYHTKPSRYDYILSSVKATSGNRMIMELSPHVTSFKPFGEQMLAVKLLVDSITDTYVRIRGTSDDDDGRVKSPWLDLSPSQLRDPLYEVAYSSDGDRFVLKIFRKNKSDKIIPVLSIEGGPLIMTTNYIEFTICTPTANIYGLSQGGQHLTLIHNMTWESEQLFARSDNRNSGLAYGVHPMYICFETNGIVHGVLLGVTQPTDILLRSQPSITTRTSGRLLDIHLFMGPTPKDIIRQMSDLIGKPSLPKPWMLGYHSCRSYGNISVAVKVAEDLFHMSHPHESDCGDSRLMKFLGENTESVLRNFKKMDVVLKKRGLKLVLHHGPQVIKSYGENMPHFFIALPSISGGGLYYGRVDEKDIIYPDFSSTGFNIWFRDAYQKLQTSFANYGIDVHGLFLVDNTPLDETIKTQKPCLIDGFKIPPIVNYLTTVYRGGDDTVCMNAVQGNGTLFHYENHNKYGHDHLKNVVDVLNASSSIHVVASLSTFTGGGHYGGHWGGSYPADWNTMKRSLIQLMEFNLYGIPFVGVPICGFSGELKDERSSIADFDPGLCWRWTQLGSLYPLAFTYYGPSESPREASFFSADFQKMSTRVWSLRYSLFPYYYSLFFNASLYGDPVIRPLFYEFPDDSEVLCIDEIFMLGPSLLIAPALHPFPDQIDIYFPRGCWYHFHTHLQLCSINGNHMKVHPSNDLPNIYIKGGEIVFQQFPVGLTIEETRLGDYTVIVALDDDGNITKSMASGNMVLGERTIVLFESSNSTFKSVCLEYCDGDFSTVSTVLEKLILLGMLRRPEVVTIDGKIIDVTTRMVYNEAVDSMEIVGIGCNLTADSIVIAWS